MTEKYEFKTELRYIQVYFHFKLDNSMLFMS